MEAYRQAEKIYKGSDIYFLDRHKDFLFINDGYHGLSILNKDLDTIKKINLFDGVIIYSVYKSFYTDELLLYCPDNNCFVLVDLVTGVHNLIQFTKDIEEVVLSSIYVWTNREIILSDYKGGLYRIDFGQYFLQKISVDEIQSENPNFYSYWSHSRDKTVLDGGHYSYLYKNRQEGHIGYWDHTKMKGVVSLFPGGFGHDVKYIDNMFINIKEDVVELIIGDSILKTIASNESFRHLRAVAAPNKQSILLFVLDVCMKDHTESMLIVYEVKQ